MRPGQLDTDPRHRVLIQIPELKPAKRSRHTDSSDSAQDGPESDRLEEPLSASAWRGINPQYVSAGLGLIFVALLFVMQPGRSNHPASTESNEALKNSVSGQPAPGNRELGNPELGNPELGNPELLARKAFQSKSDENQISNNRKPDIRVVNSGEGWLGQNINLKNRQPLESRPEFMNYPIALPQKNHSARQQNEPQNKKTGIYIDHAADGMKYYEVRLKRARQNRARHDRLRTDQEGVARFQNRIVTPSFRARHDRTEQGLY